MAALAILCAGQFIAVPSHAGELDKAAIQKLYPVYDVGERDKDLPIWPLFRHAIPASNDLMGYVFESVDVSPIAGYAGVPPNMLVAIGADGVFMSVRVLSHKEPIFQHGVDDEALKHYAGQYAGRSIKQSIKIAPVNTAPPASSSGVVYLDGIARATVSVRIMNESVLSAALKVARGKLGMSAGKDPNGELRLKPDDGTTADAATLVEKGYAGHAVIPLADITKGFGLGYVNDVEGGAGSDPDADDTEVWGAYLNVPAIGRALLGKAGYEDLMKTMREGDHAVLVASHGRYAFRSAAQRADSVPDQLAFMQDSLPVEVSEVLRVKSVESAAFGKNATWTIVRIARETGFEPARPWQIALRVTRKNGEIYTRSETKEFPVTLAAPAEFFEAPPVPLEGWRAIWFEQRDKIAFTGGMLLLLTLALAMPKRLTANTRAFSVFRLGYLAATLGGIGWWAQGQLSIHNILAVISAAAEKGDFGFLLFDPVSLLLWAFVLVSLVIFGRGTFCGWLCPFGAFQEFAAKLGGMLGIRQIKVPYAIDRKLRLLKYVVLAVIIAAAVFSPPVAEQAAEVEPFKTAITLGFDRAWPYVVYAVGLLLLSMFVFKGFCLYLCPLGATLALLGRVRAFDWIPRRKECGSPCQLCSVKCRYGAIEPKGNVRYDECFQCMDCVAIVHDPKTCVPEVLARKKKGPAPITVTAGRKAVRSQSQPEGVA